jgi:hypothetical protein
MICLFTYFFGRYPVIPIPVTSVSYHMKKIKHISYIQGTKLHFKLLTAERRHVLCVGVGGDRTHAVRPVGARHTPLPTRLGRVYIHINIYNMHYIK